MRVPGGRVRNLAERRIDEGRHKAELTPAQRDIFASLQIPCPDKIIQAALAAAAGNAQASA